MKKIANLILTVAMVMIAATLLMQCNPECEECTAEKLQPYINVKFINQDSLNTLELLKDDADELLDDNDELKDEYNDLILLGNDEYIEKRDSVDAIIASLQSIIRIYDATTSKINAGNIRLDSVIGYGSDVPILFRNEKTGDTLSAFKFPLNLNADSTRFMIKIVDQWYVFQVSYTLKEYQDINKIRLGLFNPNLDTNSFDNATIKCTFSKPECLSNETQLVLSF